MEVPWNFSAPFLLFYRKICLEGFNFLSFLLGAFLQLLKKTSEVMMLCFGLFFVRSFASLNRVCFHAQPNPATNAVLNNFSFINCFE